MCNSSCVTHAVMIAYSKLPNHPCPVALPMATENKEHQSMYADFAVTCKCKMLIITVIIDKISLNHDDFRRLE